MVLSRSSSSVTIESYLKSSPVACTFSEFKEVTNEELLEINKSVLINIVLSTPCLHGWLNSILMFCSQHYVELSILRYMLVCSLMISRNPSSLLF